MRRLDLTGHRYNRLTVLGLSERRGNRGQLMWDCRCDCGNETTVVGSSLRGKHSMTKSCGCLNAETLYTRLLVHGDSSGGKTTPEFNSWSSMMQRCTNPKAKKFPSYGGRGIQVCDRWLESFENFLADMGRKPSPSHSLDRLNNDGHYEPGNCAWRTKSEQANNTRATRYIEKDGERLTISQWSVRLGVPRAVIRSRIDRGWGVKRALSPALEKPGPKPRRAA